MPRQHRGPAKRGGGVIPEVKILSDDEVRLLHTRALDVLHKVGIKYESERVLGLLAEHGQKVDHDKGIAWLEPDLVERCLKTTPRVITLAGRDPKRSEERRVGKEGGTGTPQVKSEEKTVTVR